MKKFLICLLVLCFSLSGCKRVQDTIDEETSAENAVANSFDSTYYNTINSSGTDAREQILNDFSSNQNDFNLVGRGLQVLSLDYFSNKDHYLREGTHLSRRDYADLTGTGTDNSLQPVGTVDGITDPTLVQSIIQQEYVKKSVSGYDLAGFSIAIAIASDITTDGVVREFSQNTIETYSKEAIPKVYQYFISQYEELANVPILITVYQMAKSTDETSGKYIYSCYCNGSLGDIKSVNMQTVVFTSDEAKTIDNSLSSEFVVFKEKIKNAATDAVGVVGYGTYLNGKVINMRIEFRFNTKTYTETNTLMNIAASEIDSCFTNEFDIKGIVYTQNQLQGFIVKKAGENAASYTIY